MQPQRISRPPTLAPSRVQPTTGNRIGLISPQIAGSPGHRSSRPPTLQALASAPASAIVSARLASGERDVRIRQSARPVNAAAASSASLTPGAQATSGSPLRKPLAGQKIADIAARLGDQEIAGQAIPRIDVVLDIAVAPTGGNIGKAERARAGADRTRAGRDDAREQSEKRAGLARMFQPTSIVALASSVVSASAWPRR